MATPTLDATAGSATANTYATLAEALAYFDTHLYGSSFVDAIEDLQNKALLTATRILDEQVDWYGFKVSELQALRWPQDGQRDVDGYDIDSTIIPQFLKNATAEFAMSMIVEDRTAENDTKGFKEMQAGTLRLVIDKADRKKVIPESVRDMILAYGKLKSKSSNKVVRV